MTTDLVNEKIENFPLVIGNFQANFLIQDNCLPYTIIRDWEKHAHFHFYYEIFYVNSGEAEVNVGTKIVKINPGDFFIVPPKASHHVIKTTTDIEILCFSVMFTRPLNCDRNDVGNEVGLYLHVFSAVEEPMVINSPKTERVVEKIRSFGENSYDCSVLSKNRLQLLMASFFVEFSDTLNGFVVPNDNDGICNLPSLTDEEIVFKHKIEQFIQHNFNKSVVVDDMAAALHLSSRHLDRLIKKVMGDNFKDSLLKQRMMNARMLMDFCNVKLTDIPHLVGYQSYEGFYGAFKKFYGVSPKNYNNK